jgi:hypothetical protein
MIGIIDFESAIIGDPAQDFASLLYLGEPFTSFVINVYRALGGFSLSLKIPTCVRTPEGLLLLYLARIRQSYYLRMGKPPLCRDSDIIVQRFRIFQLHRADFLKAALEL